MTLRSLVIDSKQLSELRIDGPALCLRRSGKSQQRFPFRRISQIMCFGIPHQALGVLLLVAHHGIPITFFNHKGAVISQLIHPGALPNPLAHWLEAATGDPSLQEVYEIWLENQLRHTYGVIGCISRNSAASARQARIQLERLGRQIKCQSLLENAQTSFAGLLRTHIQMQGVQKGLPANSAALARIADDLQEVGIMLCLTWLATTLRKDHSLTPERLTLFFEGTLAKPMDNWLGRAFSTLANDLERYALDQDKTWPGR